MHFGVQHAWQCAQGALDPGRAAGAGHTFELNLQLGGLRGIACLVEALLDGLWISGCCIAAVNAALGQIDRGRLYPIKCLQRTFDPPSAAGTRHARDTKAELRGIGHGGFFLGV